MSADVHARYLEAQREIVHIFIQDRAFGKKNKTKKKPNIFYCLAKLFRPIARVFSISLLPIFFPFCFLLFYFKWNVTFLFQYRDNMMKKEEEGCMERLLSIIMSHRESSPENRSNLKEPRCLNVPHFILIDTCIKFIRFPSGIVVPFGLEFFEDQEINIFEENADSSQ